MKIKSLLSIAALVCLTAAITLAQAADPLLGTWKLNPAKSKTPVHEWHDRVRRGRRYAEGDRGSGRRRRHQVPLDLLGQVRWQGSSGHG